MCIIIVKPADKKIDEKVLSDCFANNPDGAGVSYVDNKQLVIQKGIKTSKELIDLVMPMIDRELVIHCRVASPGMVVDATNCHPFLVETQRDDDNKVARFQYAVAHNGRLEWGHTATKSDTHLFVEQFLTPMFENHPYILTHEWGEIALSRVLAHNSRPNKMAIMMFDRVDEYCKTFILNPTANGINGAGNWKDGVWFSNWSWEPRRSYESFFPQRSGQSGSTYSKEAADHYRFLCEPDANGWFWSFGWDAWINHKTLQISRNIVRQNPDYFRNPAYIPKELGGRNCITKVEVDTMLRAIYKTLDEFKEIERTIAANNHIQLALPSGNDTLLPHLDAGQKSLICKKAYDVMVWAGMRKKEISAMNAYEKVIELRQWIQTIFLNEPESLEIDGLTGQEMDEWILKKIKDGDLTIDKINQLYEKGAVTRY